MGFFGKILEKLGIKKPEQEVADKKPVASGPAPTTPRPVAPKPAAPSQVDSRPNPSETKPYTAYTPGQMAPVHAAISEVDVVSKLEGLAKANPQKLDWKVSIVDLLKLLDLDSSLASRKELAAELGCPAEKIGGDYSEMNVWLHKEVLKQIAANGGNIPLDLYK
jgi:hypothetical protein